MDNKDLNVTENVVNQSNIDNANQNDEEKGVSLSDIWHMITKHWIAIVVTFLVCVVAGGVYGVAIQKPVWRSQGSTFVLAVNSSTSDDDEKINQSNLSLSLSLLVSVRDFMNSEPVYKKIADDMNSKDEYSNLTIKDVSVVKAQARTYTSSEKSLYIDIYASTSSKQFSIDLVNSMISQSIALANDTTDVYYPVYGNVIKISSQANTPSDVSTSTTKICLITGLVGLVVGLVYAIVREMANTHVVYGSDLEQITGVKTISIIPDYYKEEEENKKTESKEKEGK